MLRKTCALTFLALALNAAVPVGKTDKAEVGALWREHRSPASLNLYYGPGGKEHQPRPPFTFVEEDSDGTNPKYLVHDSAGVKWTVKLGMEAKPETVASRLVWAAGYFANEDYFLSELKVAGVPSHLKRGRKLVSVDGTMHDARLKRHIEGEKTLGTWRWRDAPFIDTRELNGLKVMMALINNWDLKDANNKIYGRDEGGRAIYVVSDLGATFGPTNLTFPFRRSRGDLRKYVQSDFIAKVTPEYVDFRTPTRPSLIYAASPVAFVRRVRLDGTLRHVPRADIRWIANILAKLSEHQIHDAFRAAGYSPNETAAFTDVIGGRIAQLRAL